MGDSLQTGKPSCYLTDHPSQLSLAILPCTVSSGNAIVMVMAGEETANLRNSRSCDNDC